MSGHFSVIKGQQLGHIQGLTDIFKGIVSGNFSKKKRTATAGHIPRLPWHIFKGIMSADFFTHLGRRGRCLWWWVWPPGRRSCRRARGRRCSHDLYWSADRLSRIWRRPPVSCAAPTPGPLYTPLSMYTVQYSTILNKNDLAFVNMFFLMTNLACTNILTVKRERKKIFFLQRLFLVGSQFEYDTQQDLSNEVPALILYR